MIRRAMWRVWIKFKTMPILLKIFMLLCIVGIVWSKGKVKEEDERRQREMQRERRETQMERMMAEVAKSHIEGNVPSQADFDRFLQRDLTAYFRKAAGKPVTVRYELLRDGPTQTGVAYPKYYLWVKVFRDGKQSDEGAVRVAAIAKREFGVAEYLPKAEMQKQPEQIYSVFPATVGDKIKERL